MRLAFSPDGNLLVAGCYGGALYILQYTNNTWSHLKSYQHHSKDVRISSFLFFSLFLTCADHVALL